MTTIAYRNGVMAADSRVTMDSEAGGSPVFDCEKLYRKTIRDGRAKRQVIIGLAGESEPGLIFLDWYGSKTPAPQVLIDGQADFTALLLTSDGLFEVGMYCRPERVLNKFYAVGSGAKAAMGAMYAGCTAKRAVEIACLVDPYTAPPIRTMRL